ncbi:hypothetical protein MLD38_002797 [Melastoma candidum]|uniref:Uncharacterized protein n=1 Tax=Melastoma candidum TaxID=119954 RepID=A0ACB9S4Y4_9MYRT|nr:hypothetical protein MLD38_002797 [Melastoma candidum]
MASLLSPASASTTVVLSSAAPSPPPRLPLPRYPNHHTTPPPAVSLHTAVAVAAAAILTATPPSPSLAADSLPPAYRLYYGTAASAANYGGYGGNASKKDTAEYTYEVPDGWKERLVSKVEKGTNGTDSEFYNPKKRTEKEYLTFLSGFRQLAPKDAVLGNLALSDVDLQDLIASADSISSQERKDDQGQVYYVYEIEGPGGHSLISVTCAKNKLYAHFVNAPTPEWNRDKETLRHIHESFRTVGSY